MKKLIKNQSGFSAVEGLLILVIVGLIGFIGWYVWHSKSQTDKSLNTAASTSASSSTPKTATAPSTSQKPAGTVIKSADNKVEITLPEGYAMASRTDGGQYCSFASAAPALGTCISDIVYEKSSDASVGGYVKIFKTTESVADWHKTAIGVCGSPQNKTIGANPELICSLTDGHDYTVSNGQYVAYFAGDDSAQGLSVVSSIKFN